jgi:cytochrome bd-type quinol oxidase subunit 2
VDIAVKQIAIPAIIVLASAAVLLILRAIAFRFLHQWAERTETRLDDIIITSIKKPSLLFVVAIGIHVGLTFSGIPEKHLGYISKILSIIIILSVTLASSNLTGRLFKNYIQRPLSQSDGPAYGIVKGQYW